MADTSITKNASGGRYKYADMSQIHGWLEENGITYYQYIERIEGDDYIYTVPYINGKELPPRRGCRVVNAELVGIKNPAQEQGSAITYARRYSLLMAFGLCTEDDDAQCLSRPKEQKKEQKAEPKQEAPNESIYITPEQKTAILHELNRTKVPMEQVLTRYKVKTIDDIPKVCFDKLIKMLKDVPDWEDK